MDSGGIYLITSSKGGVGKSTVAVNLAFALALSGRCVMLADCDVKNRTLDIFLGYDESLMFDLADLSEGIVTEDEVILRDPRCDKLYYCTVPPAGRRIAPQDAVRAAISCADFVSADYLIIDTPGGADFPLGAKEATGYEAIIVSTTGEPSLRAASITADLLFAEGIDGLHLVINCYGSERGERRIVPMIDRVRAPLLGIVPYDAEMKSGQELGRPAATLEASVSPEAFCNIARRIEGFDVPLLDGVKIRGKSRILKRENPDDEGNDESAAPDDEA
ncbi:MAG: P-loop NTPase [Firmicutes bacterium]|nr:P-loop NTPase [Bacillota bacterium]